MFKGVALAIAGFTSMSFAADSGSDVVVETKEFLTKDLLRVEVFNQKGDVLIKGDGTDKVIIKTEKIKFGSKCFLSFKQNNRVLEIESGKRSLLSASDCEANLTITVPKKIDLKVNNVTGGIDVNNTKGDLDLKVASGDITVDSVVEELNAISGSGAIDVKGLVGNASVKLGAGKIKLGYAKDPIRGAIDIKSGSGDATLFLPPKMRIHSRVLVGSGEAYNEIGDFEDAKFLISFKAGSGNLNIKSNKATE